MLVTQPVELAPAIVEIGEVVGRLPGIVAEDPFQRELHNAAVRREQLPQTLVVALVPSPEMRPDDKVEVGLAPGALIPLAGASGQLLKCPLLDILAKVIAADCLVQAVNGQLQVQITTLISEINGLQEYLHGLGTACRHHEPCAGEKLVKLAERVDDVHVDHRLSRAHGRNRQPFQTCHIQMSGQKYKPDLADNLICREVQSRKKSRDAGFAVEIACRTLLPGLNADPDQRVNFQGFTAPLVQIDLNDTLWKAFRDKTESQGLVGHQHFS